MRAYSPISFQRAMTAGSVFWRLARIGKSVRGRFRVCFQSAIGNPAIVVHAVGALGGGHAPRAGPRPRGAALRLRLVHAKIRGMPSNDAKWIIGTVGGLLVVIGGLLLAQNAGLGAQNAAIRGEIAELRTDFRRLDDRLRAVEIALGKVEQRLETLERVMLPAVASPNWTIRGSVVPDHADAAGGAGRRSDRVASAGRRPIDDLAAHRADRTKAPERTAAYDRMMARLDEGFRWAA